MAVLRLLHMADSHQLQPGMQRELKTYSDFKYCSMKGLVDDCNVDKVDWMKQRNVASTGRNLMFECVALKDFCFSPSTNCSMDLKMSPDL